MEIAAVSSALRIVVPKIFSFLKKKHKLREDLKDDIQFVQDEFCMIAATIEEHDQCRSTTAVREEWIREVRELAYRMEDIMDRFLHRAILKPGTSSKLRQAIHRLKTTTVRTDFAIEIHKIKKLVEGVSDRRKRYHTDGGQSSTTRAPPSTSWVSCGEIPAADLVGMDVPLEELLELIREDEGQPKQLKVISIVGFGGLGKTVLAKQVYESVTAGKQYEPLIWVCASEMSKDDVLRAILQELQVGMQVYDGNCDYIKLISKCLRSKRFFIVIDDMREEYWNNIKHAFPRKSGVNSRIIVTTAIQPIANACSADDGHVYVMRTLNLEQSKLLFLKESSRYDNELAEQVVAKCDGLPLALVSISELLINGGGITMDRCADLVRCMGECVETEETLARMRQVLLHNYNNLRDHVLKACLLYLGIFPSSHPIRRKRLIRRWSAEGFVDAKNSTKKFNVLQDRSIITHVGRSNNMEAKTCRTHGMMLEFILQKCENFIMLLHYHQASPPVKVRRLSIQSNGARSVRNDPKSVDLSLVRSLTIFGKADQHFLKFNKYEVLRVLDLEECEALKEEPVNKICNLLLLRYLSFRGDIKELPKEISKLKFLETLDVRRSREMVIPIEVIKLPRLLHLLGVFKLPRQQKMGNLQTCLSEEHNLETLAGFVADKSSVFPELLNHMYSLKKVKVGCSPTIDGKNSCADLWEPILRFIRRSTDVIEAHSLSLSFNGCSQDFMDPPLKPESPCYLRSLKLQGELSSLPRFVTELSCVTELCLWSPNQLSREVLAALSNVRALQYLKLIAKHLDVFVIEKEGFTSLRRLCIVVESITGLENQEGALPRLESLWLLCKKLEGLCGVRIEHLRRLKEVTLDDVVSKKTEEEWKLVAKKHMKQPRISLINSKVEDTNIVESSVARTPEAPGIQRRASSRVVPYSETDDSGHVGVSG